MTPGTYSHVNRDQQYSTSQDFASAPPLTPGMYQEIQQYPSHCFPMSSQSGFHPNDNDAVQQTRFIPTPSQIAHTYSTYSQQTSAHTIQGNFFDPSSFDYEAANQMSFSTNGMHPQPSRIITTGRPRGSSAANLTCPNSSTSSPLSERFPCEKCGKTFSRSHDRKRHYETQHLPTPILHRCVYCRKEFSRCGTLIHILSSACHLTSLRADSLKRHLDNGCDEMHL